MRRPRKPRRPPTWTEEQDEILLEAPDLATAAARLGKARRACRTRLQRLEAPPKPPSPRKDHWTAAQDAVLLAAPSLTIAAKLTGRTRGACETRLSRVISVRRGIEASR